MSDFDKPLSRNEAILQNILGADNSLGEPQSRIEELLMQILEQGGGSGGGYDFEFSATYDTDSGSYVFAVVSGDYDTVRAKVETGEAVNGILRRYNSDETFCDNCYLTKIDYNTNLWLSLCFFDYVGGVGLFDCKWNNDGTISL